MRNDAHDRLVNTIQKELCNRGRWDTVRMEAPFYGPLQLKLKGQADLLTTRRRTVVYWELKTGEPQRGSSKARQQAQAWYGSPTYGHLTKKFVTYNPRNEYRPMIGRFRRYSR